MVMLMKTRLAEIINKRGIDKKALAQELGIETRTLNNYINEATLMNSDIIKKMAKYLNVSTDYLLGVDELDDKFLGAKVDKICNELKEIIYHLNKK